MDREPVEEGHGWTGMLFCGLLDRGLDAMAHVEHDIGIEDLVEVLGRQLEVVWFSTRGRQGGDLDPAAATAERRELARTIGR